MRSRTGRPPDFADRVKLQVYLERTERRAVEAVAKRANVSASAWVRALVLAALKDRTGRTR
jgi:hypothetical protein